MGLFVQIEQVLHGYADGHRLLAASTELPRIAKHAMLGLTDMSGRSMVPMFEEYLSAYPVPDTGLYAFAKTWYAPEMERPGCVWTHTLLLKDSQLEKLASLQRLLPYFRRPRCAFDIENYTTKVDLVTAPEEHGPVQFGTRVLAGTVLESLYGAPGEPVFVSGQPDMCEPLVLLIWNQQWPKLRRSFSFCTGSIANRKLLGRPFDLQVVPPTSIREIKRDAASASFVEPGSELEPPRDTWMRLLLDDLVAVHETRLRQFLSRYGAGFSNRGMMRPLVELSECVRELGTPISVGDLIDSVSLTYPEPDQANQLKTALFAKDLELVKLLCPQVTEIEVLRALATSANTAAFGTDDLKIPDRVRAAWSSTPSGISTIVEQLINENHNELGEQVLATAFSLMPASQAIQLLRSRPGLLASIVRRDCEIAALPIAWSGSSDQHREVFDVVVQAHNLSEDIRRRIITAMLDARIDTVAEAVVQAYGNLAVSAILDWLDSEAQRTLTYAWQKALSLCPQAVLAWAVAERPHRLEAIASCAASLDPHSSEVHGHGVDLWLNAITECTTSLDARSRIRLFSFCLALAFDNIAPNSDRLTSLTFETVHDAAAAETLDYDCWRMFEGHVPVLSAWRNWDRCERLRRGLIDRFQGQGWSLLLFLQCTSRFKTLDLLLRTCQSYLPGRDLVRRMRAERPMLLDQISPELIKAFKWYV